MATIGALWIKEYETVGWSDSVAAGGVSGPDAALPCPQEPGIEQPRIILADNPAKVSLPFAPNTRFIALCSDVPFHYAVGANPVANINSFRMPSNTRLYIGVTPGDKISALGAVATVLTAAEDAAI